MKTQGKGLDDCVEGTRLIFLGENNIYNNSCKETDRLSNPGLSFLQILALLSKLWVLLASKVLFLSSNVLLTVQSELIVYTFEN